jgi:hypothetical protein
MNTLRDEIERLAYEFFIQSGYIHGRCLHNWLEAERIILSRYAETPMVTAIVVEEMVEKPKKRTVPKNGTEKPKIKKTVKPEFKSTKTTTKQASKTKKTS